MNQMDNIEHVNAGEKKTKEGSKQNFIFCPFPHGLGRESVTRKKKEKTVPPPPTMRDQHFDLFWATAARKTMKEMVSHTRKG
jgi:hypothetical protein